MSKRELDATILSLMQEMAVTGQLDISSSQLNEHLGVSKASLNRYLRKLRANGQLHINGKGKTTRYGLSALTGVATALALDRPAVTSIQDAPAESGTLPLQWSAVTHDLKAILNQPLGLRTPITYQRQFVDQYQPNVSQLLPADLAQSLYQEGRLNGQFPASTYARKVLEQLLIDLSWTSSKLEGNRYTLLATQELFKLGRDPANPDPDAIMLLNHKDAIEFLVDATPGYGLTSMVVRNVHAMLMNNLLHEVEALGTIRQKIVNISDTVYLPAQNPHLLGEMLELIIDKARAVKNPVEAAFFLWINLAYLQPFEDGNKRVSRVCCNIPLMLYNCAPLSFMDIDPLDYTQAMMSVYELNRVEMAAELFTWTYRRSIKKYSVIIEAMGMPDPFRARYREVLGDAVRQVVEGGRNIEQAMQQLPIAPEPIAPDEQAAFAAMLQLDLRSLDVFNCARYRLSLLKTEEWVKRGRPI